MVFIYFTSRPLVMEHMENWNDGSHRGHWRGNFLTPPTFEGKCRSSSKRKWREIRFVRILNWNGATMGKM
jgi:hypothetical protein